MKPETETAAQQANQMCNTPCSPYTLLVTGMPFPNLKAHSVIVHLLIPISCLHLIVK